MSSEEQALANAFTSENIARMLRTNGPVVKCVLLQCTDPMNEKKVATQNPDEKRTSISSLNDDTSHDHSVNSSRVVLEEFIQEIEIDTTPKKSEVQQVLKGPFTFLGQYEDEGIMVIVRRDFDQPSEENGILNPHQLQPPLHNANVYGDILLMKIAPNEDQEDVEGEDGKVPQTVLSNDEFFLNYTKEEYITFAKRTDIVPVDAHEEEESGDEEQVSGEDGDDNEEDNDEEDEDEEEEDVDDEEEDSDEYEPNGEEDDDEIDEEDQIGMMNMILSQVLVRFREDNGRGPDTEELLSIRSALAEKLGIDLSVVDPSPGVEEAKDDTITVPSLGKRELGDSSPDSSKRVKFSNDTEVKVLTDDEAGADVHE